MPADALEGPTILLPSLRTLPTALLRPPPSYPPLPISSHPIPSTIHLHCGDQFARSDLLSRHVNKCHAAEKALALGGGGPSALAHGQSGRRKGTTAATRATTSKQACDQCVQNSLACDGSNPCAFIWFLEPLFGDPSSVRCFLIASLDVVRFASIYSRRVWRFCTFLASRLASYLSRVGVWVRVWTRAVGRVDAGSGSVIGSVIASRRPRRERHVVFELWVEVAVAVLPRGGVSSGGGAGGFVVALRCVARRALDVRSNGVGWGEVAVLPLPRGRREVVICVYRRCSPAKEARRSGERAVQWRSADADDDGVVRVTVTQRRGRRIGVLSVSVLELCSPAKEPCSGGSAARLVYRRCWSLRAHGSFG
ncbi:hypothetical protein B0H13DRAFT_2516476 [Mycena leptocephala]|nr:hypothetical protein B0H13DRAFT_2516476 [Mycena leptocephala]